MDFKRIIVRAFFSVEVLVCCCVYMWGKNSIATLVGLQKENQVLQGQLQGEEREIVQLENEISRWGSDPFYKEKVAREQLQMARIGERVYYIAS